MGSNDPPPPIQSLEDLAERLDRIEKRVSQTNTSGGGIGCLGLLLFGWVLVLLYRILERIAA